MNDEFDDLKNKFVRTVRANLNDLLDRIKDIDDSEHEQGGFEHIGKGASSQIKPPKSSSDKTIRDYYANLEVEYGADLDTVKASYRKLLRQYHPDKFAHDPNMENISTELTQELTRAYQAVESYIKTGQY